MAHTHLSGLGLVLVLVFGCLLLALIAELYYLLWWKKQLVNNSNNNTIEEDYSNHTKEMFYLFCWDKPNNSIITHQNSTSNTPNPVVNTHDPDLEMGLGGNGKDLVFKALAEEGVEAELMRLHNLMGPPRFLFTIKEESKEDLESDDGKSKCGDRSRKGSRTRSLGDLIVAFDSQTPFLSPINDSGRDDTTSFDGIRCINDGMIAPSRDSSDGIRCISASMIAPSNSNSMRFSPMKGTTPNDLGHYNSSSSCNYSNPLFESSMEAELFRLRASPPPKFKFLRDAEEKLYRRLLEEAQKSGILGQEGILDNSVLHPCCTTTIDEEEDVSLRSSCSSQEGILDNSQSHNPSVSIAPTNCEVRETRMSSCSSQVLPLVSSPPDHALLSSSIEKNPSLH